MSGVTRWGPDGALYVISYGHSWYKPSAQAALSRYTYKGNCRPADIVPEKAGCTDNRYREYDKNIPVAFHDSSACVNLGTDVEVQGISGGIRINNLKVGINEQGPHSLVLTNILGKVLYKTSGEGKREYQLPTELKQGIYFLRMTTPRGTLTQKVFY